MMRAQLRRLRSLLPNILEWNNKKSIIRICLQHCKITAKYLEAVQEWSPFSTTSRTSLRRAYNDFRVLGYDAKGARPALPDHGGIQLQWSPPQLTEAISQSDANTSELKS